MKFKKYLGTLLPALQNSCNELESGSRRSMVSRARAEIARRGMEELGLSAAEIARHLGVATSSITRAVAKAQKQFVVQRK